jgi:hypothetical protein
MRVVKWCLLVFAGIAAGFMLWGAAGYPHSVAEALFLHRLAKQIEAGTDTIDLAALMPGDWELMCDGHAYNDGAYVAKYNRKYPAVSHSDKGAWGLLFISPDGSYNYASGTCPITNALLDGSGCWPRDQAVLYRRRDRSQTCPLYDKSADRRR